MHHVTTSTNSFGKTLGRISVPGCFVALGALGAMSALPGLALAQYDQDQYEDAPIEQEAALSGAREDVYEAATVVQQMRAQDDLRAPISQARGIFIIPDYASVALGVGVAGGEGVFIENRLGEWSDPLFYDVGSVSAGAQAGITAGSLALVLMSEDAVSGFYQDNNFSLNAEAGLTIINWAAEAEADWGRGDVIVWTDVEGLMGQIALTIEDINYDEEETAEYYNQEVSQAQVLAGEIVNPNEPVLRSEFAEFTESAGHDDLIQ